MAYIEITFQGLSTVSFGSHCALTQVRTACVTLPAPLGKRDIIIDQFGTFAPTNGTLMRRCSDLGAPAVSRGCLRTIPRPFPELGWHAPSRRRQPR